jgi:membrane protein required for colicin V production
MNWVDAVIIGAIVWFTFAAFQAGLIREVVTVVSVLLGIVLAGIFYTDLAEDIKLAIDSDRAARTIAFLAIFGATAFAGQLAAMLLKEAASFLMLGIFDQLAGAVFGFAKAILLLQILMIVFVTYPSLGLKEAIDGSMFAPIFLDRVPFLLRVLPSEFEAGVDAF